VSAVRIEPYTTGCAELVAELGAGDLEQARATLARDPSRVRAVIDAELAAWDREGLGTRELLCHDTGTHHKWFVGVVEPRATVIWLHEYKPAARRADTHALTIHNHRYAFASAVLRGGYDHEHYVLDADGRPTLAATERYRPPDSYVIGADELHRVSGLLDGTVTLIVQGPIERGHSAVFDASGRVREHVANARRLPDLRRTINGAASDD
jgi:hypothetical protein